jgi:hypothetical protein
MAIFAALRRLAGDEAERAKARLRRIPGLLSLGASARGCRCINAGADLLHHHHHYHQFWPASLLPRKGTPHLASTEPDITHNTQHSRPPPRPPPPGYRYCVIGYHDAPRPPARDVTLPTATGAERLNALRHHQTLRLGSANTFHKEIKQSPRVISVHWRASRFVLCMGDAHATPLSRTR